MAHLEYRVRPFSEEDLAEWFRLRSLLWDEVAEEDHRSEMLDIVEHPETQLVIVAERSDGGLAGFLEASIRPFVEDCLSDSVGYLEGWYVDTDFRRQGIGRAMVSAAENWARSKGCIEMASDAEIGNDQSIAAHLNLGYGISSRLVHLRKDIL